MEHGSRIGLVHRFCSRRNRAGVSRTDELPRAGESVNHPQVKNLRRILLSQVHYHLYCTVADDAEVVEVLELWHTSRGEGPRH